MLLEVFGRMRQRGSRGLPLLDAGSALSIQRVGCSLVFRDVMRCNVMNGVPLPLFGSSSPTPYSIYVPVHVLYPLSITSNQHLTVLLAVLRHSPVTAYMMESSSSLETLAATAAPILAQAPNSEVSESVWTAAIRGWRIPWVCGVCRSV